MCVCARKALFVHRCIYKYIHSGIERFPVLGTMYANFLPTTIMAILYVRTCIIYIYTHFYIVLHKHVHVHIQMRIVRIRKREHTAHMPTPTHTHTHTHARTHAHTHTYTYTSCTHMYVLSCTSAAGCAFLYECITICLPTRLFNDLNESDRRACMLVPMHA